MCDPLLSDFPRCGKEVGDPDGFSAFDETESMLVSESIGLLRALRSPDCDLIRSRIAALSDLGAAIARFPSVGETQVLGDVTRGPDTLKTHLRRHSGSPLLLRTPSRVVLGRGFRVAKIHALSFAAMAVSFDPSLYARLRACILSVVFSLLAEDVYEAGLGDDESSDEKRTALAADLVSLWDDLRDPRAVVHVPALSELWAARDGHVPVFGTMEGASELARLSFDLSDSWFSFVSRRLRDKQTQYALEEFLFGLSFEEIALVRSRMAACKLHCADADEIRRYLGGKTAFAPVDGTDPRAMYEFYVERREAARFRAKAGAPGPRRTLEEFYLAFLISR